jgi:hypothetical protein
MDGEVNWEQRCAQLQQELGAARADAERLTTANKSLGIETINKHRLIAAAVQTIGHCRGQADRIRAALKGYRDPRILTAREAAGQMRDRIDKMMESEIPDHPDTVAVSRIQMLLECGIDLLITSPQSSEESILEVQLDPQEHVRDKLGTIDVETALRDCRQTGT